MLSHLLLAAIHPVTDNYVAHCISELFYLITRFYPRAGREPSEQNHVFVMTYFGLHSEIDL